MPRFPLRLFRLPTTRAARRRRFYTMIIALLTVLTFVTPFYIIYKPPHLLIAYFQHRWPDVLWHVPLASGKETAGGEKGKEKDKVIALTIDDAPSEFSGDIARLLEGYGARATFFVIGGQVKGREAGLQDLVRGGHELGNHAMHDEPSRSLSPSTLTAELREVESYINGTYDAVRIPHPPRYFRPGSGFFSTRMRQQVKELGYRIVLGSVYPHDPQIPHPAFNAKHILSMVRPGSIIICHDRRGWTVPMLMEVLPELKRRGYRVTTVSGLLEAAAGKRGAVERLEDTT
ncbi:glycoside hydrolase/deacetylase [Clathrospora elynae]|uniref:chitin deacetylase n=1 Tax=Clathrospora elynae TaxID=706981 RepID=A0A6A5T5Y8_9PLEO|nr:glycoside hydrolase/deacetylase [Clathrospora elynae]